MGALFGSSRFRRDSSSQGHSSPTVSSGMAMRVSATIATVDNRSRPELTKGVGGAEGVRGGPSLSFTAGPDQAKVASCGGSSGRSHPLVSGSTGGVATGAIKFTEGAGTAVRLRLGAGVLIGTATAAVGMGALPASSALEWYPNQNTVAGAGVASGNRGWKRFAGRYSNEGADAGTGAGAGSLRSGNATRFSNRYFSALERAFHRLW